MPGQIDPTARVEADAFALEPHPLSERGVGIEPRQAQASSRRDHPEPRQRRAFR
jgi:hypothetical protein